jgi:hypothetical protein
MFAVGLVMASYNDCFFLQVKEARASALAPYAGRSVHANHGGRVIVGQARPGPVVFTVADKMASEDTLHREPATMEYRVSYEHSFTNAPDDFIAQVPCQVVDDVPVNIPRALLTEFITDLILKRSPGIGKIRNFRLL